MTKAEIKQRLRQIAAENSCELFFKKKKAMGGAKGIACPTLRKIVVARSIIYDSLSSVFFHELAHIKLYDAGKFKAYHHGVGRPKTLKELSKRTGILSLMIVRVENAANKLGASLMKQYFPQRKFTLRKVEGRQAYYYQNMVSAWYFGMKKRLFEK